MKLDLAKAAEKRAKGSTAMRAEWSGGVVELDEAGFLELTARGVATQMGRHLFEGRTPDGSGSMPPRKYDGAPRGSGAKIARALHPRKTGPLSWLIAAHREKIGHLARIMEGVPFAAPPLDTIQDTIRRAFELAVRLEGERANARTADDLGGFVDRRSSMRTQRRLRGHTQTLGSLGAGKRSKLTRMVRKAARVTPRRRRVGGAR